MSNFIDARKLECPMPVIMAKKELDKGDKSITVLVDNEVAVENLKRMAANTGLTVEAVPEEDYFKVMFEGGAAEEDKQSKSGYNVFFGKDYVGEGDKTLGRNLAKMMLYTLSESESLPQSIVFMNEGVKLPTSDVLDIINSINVLIEKGVKILVCGTCLNFYELAPMLKAGTVSNMYEILEELKSADKVITV